MLDFLGLRYEAELLLLYCTSAFIFGGFGYGLFLTATEGKKQTFRNLIAWISVGLAVIAVVLSCIVGMILLITFRWGQLAKALVIAIGLGSLSLWLISKILMHRSARKYRKNPLVKEIIRYCKDQNIVGIQCFPDRVRFFRALENADYCKSDTSSHYKDSAQSATAAEKQDLRPLTWQAYDHPASLVSVLKFADRDYPDLPDVSIFALALAKGIGGCKVASHSTEVKYSYDQYNKSTGRQEHVNHTTVTYQDYFVYKIKARNALSRSGVLQKFQDTKQQKAQERIQKKAQKKAEKENPPNRWV